MTHLELFAGVGGFRTAMNHIQQDLGMINDVIGFSEIDAKATATYKANYDTANEIEMGDIVAFIKDKARFDNIPHFNLLTGGFPCQTFSMMGNQAGFNEDRGQMFFRIMDIAHAYHPNFIFLENVKNLMNHDNKRTYRRIKEELEAEHYIVHEDIFNTNAFGLPQKRNRVIIFARKEEFGDFEFSFERVKNHFDALNPNNLSIGIYDSVLDVLSPEVEGKYYLSVATDKSNVYYNGANDRTYDTNGAVEKTYVGDPQKVGTAYYDYIEFEHVEEPGKPSPFTVGANFIFTDQWKNDLMSNSFSEATFNADTGKIMFNPSAPRYLVAQGYNIIGWTVEELKNGSYVPVVGLNVAGNTTDTNGYVSLRTNEEVAYDWDVEKGNIDNGCVAINSAAFPAG